MKVMPLYVALGIGWFAGTVCLAQAAGDLVNCTHYAFSGYFGFSQNSLRLYKNYPNGGLAEYMVPR